VYCIALSVILPEMETEDRLKCESELISICVDVYVIKKEVDIKASSLHFQYRPSAIR